MAVPTFFATGAAVAGVASVTAEWPVSHAVNDIGILIIETSGDGTQLDPGSGWVHVTGSPFTDLALVTGSRLHVLWKRATTTTEAGIATGDSGDHQFARIFVFRGCATTGDPWNAVATTFDAVGSSTATWPSVTTTVNDCLIGLIASRPDDVAAATHWGVPSGGTGLTSHAGGQEVGSTQGNGGGFVMCWAEMLTAGSTGAPTATKTASTTSALMTLALTATAAAVAAVPYRNPMPPLIAQ